MSTIIDVPSPIDLRLMADARSWAESALARRPVRPEFFDAFAREVGRDDARVLELGSGPGFLAEHLLRAGFSSVEPVLVKGGLALHRAC